MTEIKEGDKFRINVPEGAEFKCEIATDTFVSWWENGEAGVMYVPVSWCTKVEPPYEPQAGDIVRLPSGVVDEVLEEAGNTGCWLLRASIRTWLSRDLMLVYRPEVTA